MSALASRIAGAPISWGVCEVPGWGYQLPADVVLEQIEILGKEVVPVLRREFEARRPEHVPSDPPTHASLVAQGPDSRHLLVAPAADVAEADAAAADNNQ